MVNQVTMANAVKPVLKETLVQLDPLVSLALRVLLVKPVQLGNLVFPDRQELLVNLVIKDLSDSPV